MSFFSLGVSLALAAFLAVDVMASLVTALVWRAARGDQDRVGARARADGLFLLRVLPPLAAIILVAGVLLPAFLTFEPRGTGEIAGGSLVALALVSALLILTSVRRGWLASRATRAVLREWLERARPLALPGLRHIRAYAIQAEFPVVSLVGVLRPRLFISERVLEACTPEELAAMVRHECGHLVAGDNVKRFVLRLCPNGLLAATRQDLERSWNEACEEAADDYAARASAPSALVLANALLRVARMAPSPSAAIAALTTLYQGDSIERRVRRLVGTSPLGGSRAAWLVAVRALAVVPLALAVTVLLDGHLLRAVHSLIEVVVETLP